MDYSRGAHDLVVDIDALYDCLGTDRASVKTEMFACLNILYDDIRTRSGRWRNAWVLTAGTTEAKLRRLDDALGGAERVHIVADYEKMRAEAVKRGGLWLDWVEESCTSPLPKS